MLPFPFPRQLEWGKLQKVNISGEKREIKDVTVPLQGRPDPPSEKAVSPREKREEKAHSRTMLSTASSQWSVEQGAWAQWEAVLHALSKAQLLSLG